MGAAVDQEKVKADKRLVATDREKNSVERILLAIDQKAWREKVHQLVKDLKEGRARPEVDKAKLDEEEADIHRRQPSFHVSLLDTPRTRYRCSLVLKALERTSFFLSFSLEPWLLSLKPICTTSSVLWLY
jgi:hypothetical protein